MFPTENGYRDRIEDRFDAQEQRCFHGVDLFDPDGKQDIGETVLEHGKDQQPDDIVHVKDQGIGKQERKAHKKAQKPALSTKQTDARRLGKTGVFALF